MSTPACRWTRIFNRGGLESTRGGHRHQRGERWPIELHGPGALLAERPGAELTIIIGGDLVEERARWHGWAELCTLVRFLVVGRVGARTAATPAGARDSIIDIELPGLSSTEARRRIAAGEATTGLLDETVRAYIDEHGLYRRGA